MCRSTFRLLTFAITVALLLATPVLHADDAPVVPSLPLGSAAPAFSLPGVDGKTYSLASFKRAKVLVIVFTCNHCPTAQAYEERIKTLVTDYKAKGVALVAISPNDPDALRPDELGYSDLDDGFADMKIRARDHKFNFPYLFGGGKYEATSKAYGPVATPHAFVFDAERKLRYLGRVDDSEREALVKTTDLRNALDAVLAGKPVDLGQTKVFGCSTKWSSKRPSVKAFFEKAAAEPVTVTPVDAAGLVELKKNAADPGTRGKLRLVNLWATWCGPCVSEFPDLVGINLKFRQREFELVTVAAQFPDEQADVLAFLQKQRASGRNLIFSGTDKYKLVEAVDPKWEGALPYTMLLAPGGEVLYRQQGDFDTLALRRAIVAGFAKMRRP